MFLFRIVSLRLLSNERLVRQLVNSLQFGNLVSSDIGERKKGALLASDDKLVFIEIGDFGGIPSGTDVSQILVSNAMAEISSTISPQFIIGLGR